MKLVVVNGGVGTPSATKILATRLQDAAAHYATDRDLTLDSQMISIRSLATAVTAMQVSGLPDPQVEEALDLLEESDGVIMVSPVYAGSYAGMFKMFTDLIGNERLAGTPVLIAATGGSPRHSLMLDYAMRPLMTALRAVTVPTGIFAATNDFGSGDQQELEDRISVGIGQLMHSMVAFSGAHHDAPAHTQGPLPTTRDVITHSNARIQRRQTRNAQELLDTTQSNHHRNRGQIPYLTSNGASGRLRPDTDDFVPMGTLLGREGGVDRN